MLILISVSDAAQFDCMGPTLPYIETCGDQHSGLLSRRDR